MHTSLFLRRLFIPTSTCSLVVYAQKEESSSEECDPDKPLLKSKELPLYKEEKQCPKCEDKPRKDYSKSLLMETMKCAREELWVLMDQFRIVKQQVKEYYYVVKDQTQDGIEYLREESNFFPRMGAIAVGGLAGYITALRKGRFKRLMYTGAGAGIMSAICYPREAQEYTDETLKILKKYVIISYHFMNGDETDMSQFIMEEKLPVKRMEVIEEEEEPEDKVDPGCKCPNHPAAFKERVEETEQTINKDEKNKDVKNKDEKKVQADQKNKISSDKPNADAEKSKPCGSRQKKEVVKNETGANEQPC